MPRHTDNHWLETIASTGIAVSNPATQYTEDTAAAANPIGNMTIARRKDTLSASEVSADGDNIALNATSKGELYVKQTDTVPVSQATLLAGEDLINNVMAIMPKPVASNSYTGTSFIAVLNDVDISVKAAAGNLLSVSCSSINAAIRYLQLHNKATAPAGGDTAIFSFPIAAGSATVPASVTIGRDFFGQHGHHFTTGIAVGVSTAAATFTAATTTDHVVNGTYV
jgi:hypothetical protein